MNNVNQHLTNRSQDGEDVANALVEAIEANYSNMAMARVAELIIVGIVAQMNIEVMENGEIVDELEVDRFDEGGYTLTIYSTEIALGLDVREVTASMRGILSLGGGTAAQIAAAAFAARSVLRDARI